MSEPGAQAPSNIVRLLLIAIVVSALVGGTAGYIFAPKTVTGTPPSSTHVPQTREFFLFTDSLNFNETTLGIPHDIFVPDRMLVLVNDTVLIHYYNIEDVNESHTFTMDAPYARNLIVHQNEVVNITFVASVPGIFRYYCVYHEPTMYGYLAVLEP